MTSQTFELKHLTTPSAMIGLQVAQSPSESALLGRFERLGGIKKTTAQTWPYEMVAVHAKKTTDW